MTGQVAFVDTETLGLDADVHPVWEIGLILPDGVEYTWQVKVTDRELSLAHPRALEIGRFAERYNKTDEPRPRSWIARSLVEIIEPGLHLAGAVVSFDEERLRRLLWAEGYTPPWHYHLVDVEALGAGALGIPPPWSSAELSMGLGVDPDAFERHTALGDARWAKALYVAALSGRRRETKGPA